MWNWSSNMCGLCSGRMGLIEPILSDLGLGFELHRIPCPARHDVSQIIHRAANILFVDEKRCDAEPHDIGLVNAGGGKPRFLRRVGWLSARQSAFLIGPASSCHPV